MIQPITIILADDDEDDIMLFKKAISELQINVTLIIAQNGEQLMQLLQKNEQLPEMVFLDMNMPCKNGFTCLTEIKQDEKLKSIPVIILSTSSEKKVLNQLYENGAQFFIRKPNEFSLLKNLIKKAITLITNGNNAKRTIAEFVLQEEAYKNENK